MKSGRNRAHMSNAAHFWQTTTFEAGLIVLLILAGSMVKVGWADNATQAPSASAGPNNSNLVARGKYIVEGVAVCGQCHTPRDSDGRPDNSRQLEGAPVWLQPAQPVADWPLQAPRIAGIPPGTDAQMVTLLTTGIWTNGKQLRPPMPQFRMNRDDAEAVVAYLKTLNPKRL
jgi:mono/diheme cytochrome c family protein